MLTKKLILLVLFAGMVSVKADHTQRFQSLGFNSAFGFDTTQDFETYVLNTKKIIRKSRIDLTDLNIAQEVIEGNAPFIFKPKANQICEQTKGIILVHGLKDSPYSIKDIAHDLNAKCFLVYSILLTGHGTRIGDTLDIDYNDWRKQVAYGVQQISKRVDVLYLGGFSMGGTLAIDYVLENSDANVSGLVLFSPAVAIPSVAKYAGIVSFFRDFLDIYDDEDRFKYESLSYNAIAQAYNLTQRVQDNLESSPNKLRALDVFVALSYEDQTIDLQKSLNLLLENTNADTRHIVLYHQNTLPEEISGAKNVYPVNSNLVDQKILGLAHISIPIKPTNKWYGKNGKYRNCLSHYDTDNYQRCKTQPDIFMGEVTSSNLAAHPSLVRLTYNPLYSGLIGSIYNFIGT